MKRLLSVILALTMAFAVVLPAFSAAPKTASFWNAARSRFVLKEAPIITRLSEHTDYSGTQVFADYRIGGELRALMDADAAVFGSTEKLYAQYLGVDEERVYRADLDVGIQFAYSFDGTNWVFDWQPEPDPSLNTELDPDKATDEQLEKYWEGFSWAGETYFDLDHDGFTEYAEMPLHGVASDSRYQQAMVVNGRANCFTAWWASPDGKMNTVRKAINKCNEKMLQGKGEKLGSYDPDSDEGGRGCAIDFNKNTVYVKARYRVYNALTYERNDGSEYAWECVSYSDWSKPVSYTNGADVSQPDVNVLKGNEPITLTLLGVKRTEEKINGAKMKVSDFMFTVSYSDALEEALAAFYATEDTRAELVGEYFPPKLVYEIRVGSGEWYLFDYPDADGTYLHFSDAEDGVRDELEALGYQPGDPVYLRAVVYGSDSVRYIKDDNVGYWRVSDADVVRIRSAVSNVVELSLTGKYNVRYELNGGSFDYDTEQLGQFDEDTNVTVDLTAADYIPARRNYVFKGWFEDEAFTKPVTSFTTAEKRSRSFYAKWEEKPYYTITYDMGVIKGQVYNPNPDRIYPDDGAEEDGVIALNAPEYEGARFLGWYDAAEGGSKVETLKFAELTGNVTLYARWELPTYTITYAGAGTDYTNSEKNPASFRIAPDEGVDVLLYAPVKKGWIFDGWFYNSEFEGGLPYDEEAGVWHMTSAENVTVYAKFIRGRWNINYVLGLEDAWNGANPDTYTYGTAVELQNPERTGYIFNGWFADPEFEHELVSVAADSEGEITVYAKWTVIKYKIIYDLRDENIVEFFNNENPTERTADDEVVFKPLVPLNGLFRFLGWYNNVNFDGEPVVKIASGTDKDVTVYARLYKYTWGDVDCDGKVTASDARLLLRKAVDLIDEEFTDDLIPWSDFDADGKITASDARTALRMAVELDTVESLGLPEAPTAYKDE